MNFQRLRPEWTIGTLLTVVAWSSVVVWLNTIPRTIEYGGSVYSSEYGFPFGFVTKLDVVGHELGVFRFYSELWRLPCNIAIGVVAVTALTWLSSCLLLGVASEPNNGKNDEK